MGNVFLEGVLGIFAVTFAISFAVPPKDVPPLGDDTINFVNNFKLPFKPNERKLEESASQKSTLRSGNQVNTVTKRDTGDDRTQRLIVEGSGNHVIEGDVNNGVTLRGSAKLTIRGNVQGGAIVSGSENFSVDGDVRGGIAITGSRTMNVGGDVYADINASGSSIIAVQGSHHGGSVTKSDSAQVHILDYNLPKLKKILMC